MRSKNTKYHYRLALILLAIVSPQVAQAQSAHDRHHKIRAAVESGNDPAALAELQALRSAEPSVFALNNYDYLLARLAERRGDLATAAASYQAVLERNSLLSQYALWHLARFARSTGNLTLEREHLRQLLVSAPTSLLRAAAVARLGESFYESGDYASAIKTLRPGTAATGGPAARQALALIGQAYLRSEQQAAARNVFNSLVMQLPDLSRPDDFALAGVRGLDLLDSGSAEAAPKSAPQLPESEHLRRALIYNFNRDFAGARLHYSAIVERYGQSASVPDALFQIGRSFFQERRYDEAITHFQRVFTQYPESPSARDALGFAGSAYGRLKRTDEAVAAYRQLIERYPDAPNPERPFLNIIDSLREAGRDGEALDWVRQTRERFKGRDGAALALFSQARIHLSRGAWDAALADFNALRGEAELGGTRLPGGTTQTEVAFMRAYVLEKLGRTDDAINAYLAIPDGRDEYYGGRATARLRALAADARTRAGILARAEALRADAQRELPSVQAEKARINAQSALRLTEDAALIRELLDIARRAYAFLPAYNSIPNPRLLAVGRQDVINEGLRKDEATPTHLALAGELLFLGLYDEGAPELAAAEDAFGAGGAEERKSARGLEADGQVAASSRAKPQTTQPPRLTRDATFTLAVYFKRGDVAHRAVSFAEPLWKAVPRDYLLELAPREMVELLYPAPYAAALLEHAPPRGVDPRFVLAIARQESRFLPSAKSASAARGLMQFIPSTALEIAAQLGRRAFSQDDLYDPRVSLLFGSQYLGNLFRQFPAMPHAVAAAYNGGEDNVARWVDRARSHEPDQYVLEIGFAQSKDYVYRVIANQRVYQSLYTEQLQRR